MEQASERGKRVAEIVNGIKLIKFNAWEKLIINNIQNIRIKERRLLFKMFFLRGLSTSLSILVPALCSLVCFSLYQNYFDDFTVAKVFSIMTLLSNLLHPVRIFFMAMDSRTAALVSSERLNAIMKLQD